MKTFKEPKTFSRIDDLKISDSVEMVIYENNKTRMTCIFNYAYGIVAISRDNESGYELQRLNKQCARIGLLSDISLNHMKDFLI